MPALLRQQRQATFPRVPAHVVRKRPKPVRHLEADYATRLVMAVTQVQQQIEEHVLPHVEKWVEEVQSRRADAIHLDAGVFETVGRLFNRLRLNIGARLSPLTTLARMAGSGVATKISEANKQNARPVLQRLLPVDPFKSEPWLKPVSEDWISENVSLIKSVGEKHLTEVEQLIYRMVRQGDSIKDVRTELRKRFEVTKNRARLIARDQVNKFNGQLTQERQERAGITMYRWRTMRDARVRGTPGGLYAGASPSHALMEGILCRWDDPTVYFDERRKKWVPRTSQMEKLHPGQPIQDRCYAEPVIEVPLVA